MSVLQTEFEFTLPFGYQDAEGTLHREGVMRLARASDEIEPLRDARVRANEAYLVVILLSRVITRLGTVTHINPKVIEDLYAMDLAYLQEFYNEVNRSGASRVPAMCPHCERDFELELSGVGGVLGHRLEVVLEEVAFVAYHFHWPMSEILELEHADRRRWVEEISAINRRMAEEAVA